MMKKTMMILMLLSVCATASAAVVNTNDVPNTITNVHWNPGGYGNHHAF